MKTFGIIGAAGYIAQRHMESIAAVGGKLMAVCDLSDSVGIVDRYGYEVLMYRDTWDFFDEVRADYVVVCTPNWLHKEHVIGALETGADVLCEKPLAVTVEEVEEIMRWEEMSHGTVNTVLQLRLNPVLQALRVQLMKRTKPVTAVLEYIAPRGPWYDESWKGDDTLSGGLAMNIGIHFFDTLIWMLGPVSKVGVKLAEGRRMEGALIFEQGDRVDWVLSTDPKDTGGTAIRRLVIDGKGYDFSAGFTNLHTKVYEEMLAGRGATTEDALPSVEVCAEIRRQTQYRDSI